MVSVTFEDVTNYTSARAYCSRVHAHPYTHRAFIDVFREVAGAWGRGRDALLSKNQKNKSPSFQQCNTFYIKMSLEQMIPNTYNCKQQNYMLLWYYRVGRHPLWSWDLSKIIEVWRIIWIWTVADENNTFCM